MAVIEKILNKRASGGGSSGGLQGTWNATTNTPTLANTDTGKTGFMYQVSTGGTVDFGAGNITFEAKDIVVNNGTVWDKIDSTDAVVSVNGNTGVVVLDADDISDTSTTKKFTNATDITKLSNIEENATANPNAFDKTTDDLDDINEGATNKAFTSTLKNKLDNIEANAEVNTVTSVASKTGAVSLVKGDVGLGNVDNTSDANKPVSTAQQTALNGKANTSHTHNASDINAGVLSASRIPSNFTVQVNYSGAVSWDGLPPPTIIADSSGTYVDYPVTGAAVGQRVNATLRGVTESNIIVRGEVTSANNVRVHYARVSGTTDLTEKIIDISIYNLNT